MPNSSSVNDVEIWLGSYDEANRKLYNGKIYGDNASYEAMLSTDIVIENPVPIKMFGLPEPTQKVEPYMFGVPVSKTTCLWLKGVRRICPTNVIKPQYTFNEYPLFKNSHGKYKQKNRSKTFEEVAAAMALSWGDLT